MKLVWWMLSGSILTALILTVLIRPENRLELWIGMLGPLSSAVASWIAMHRKYIRRPDGLTALMIKAFAAKMIFFAVFITVLVSFGWIQPIPFVISFVGYFLALHMMEAIGLRRLQASGGSTRPAKLQGQ
jgi:F0F1-type ATP synthase assembly protein I